MTHLPTRVRPDSRPVRAIILTSALFLAPVALAQEAEPPEIYRFQVELAPVCLDGAFPLALNGGTTTGNATLVTDTKGKLTGQVTLDGLPYALTGSVKATKKGLSLSLTGRNDKKNRVTLKGVLEGSKFTGSSTGKGAVAAGKGTFELDVSTAGPQIATVVAQVTQGRGSSLKGTASVQVCGPAVEGKASGSRNRKGHLSVKISGFKFTGNGSADGRRFDLKWSASGFGAKTKGESLRITEESVSLAPSTLAVDSDAAAHLLKRTHFGVSAGKRAELAAKGLSQFVDDMVAIPTTETQVEIDAFPELVNVSDPANAIGKYPSSADIARWWLHLMTYSDTPFQEVQALFWHDHFAVNSEVLGSTELYWMVDYVNLYRRNGTGNYRDLLLAMSRDPAMLDYLDGLRSTRTAPNENFAREFWELFTLGADNGYTQEEIVESSRAFTGYRTRTDDATGLTYVSFDTGRHDATAKTILGVTIPGQNVTDDYEAVVDITLDNRPAAEFITKKIFETFCYTNPDETLVAELAALLRDNDWDLAHFWRTLFKSEAFFSARSRGAFVKNPVEYGIGFTRTTGLLLRVDEMDDLLTNLGQLPTRPPTVDGWPSGTEWLSAQALVDRTNLAWEAITDLSRHQTEGIAVQDILPPENERTAGAVIDTCVDLLDVKLVEGDREDLLDYLNTDRQSNGSVVESPFDGTNQTHLDERVRGLLHILAQHPTYQVR